MRMERSSIAGPLPKHERLAPVSYTALSDGAGSHVFSVGQGNFLEIKTAAVEIHLFDVHWL